MSVAYYNEHDQVDAEWLRNLVAAGHIAPGDVDERDIRDVHPDDLRPYAQCHFFAGVGVWSYALRRAGWPDDRPVWTGSCPCQPFSAAGKGLGFDDERHLWPAWYWLIGQRRPVAVLGEQVASAAGLGWLDRVCTDLEDADYACGAVDFCARRVGFPLRRSRLLFMAHPYRQRQPWRPQPNRRAVEPEQCTSRRSHVGGCSAAALPDWRDVVGADGNRRLLESGTEPLVDGAAGHVGRLRAYGNAIHAEAAVAWIEACRGVIG
ncbi:DNA cytosine methyltransferase [Burkholderia thailandensis]|uniref:DNA cytosine methyltransferase n=1 Tax=Burkholderia thailandensis TaxID=57975 RepID=UPI00217E4838|nr:DNA cytosine methyltransferase [Burkholderia thailandensis]MCS6516948.1 DNA cytosine methyltransferase [Burkholderia thailandensis]